MKAFKDAIIHDRRSPVSGEEAKIALRVAIAANQPLRSLCRFPKPFKSSSTLLYSVLVVLK